MKVELISIGDELLSGFIVNRNAAYIGKILDEVNLTVDYMTTVGDEVASIAASLKAAGERASFIICTGGLGPTSDDVTMQGAARYFNRKLVFQKEILESIKEKFRKRGRVMAPENRKQAELPEGAEVIENRIGSAPGVRIKHEESVYYFLPGVPIEMQNMMQQHVLPFLKRHYPPGGIKQKIIRTTGIFESDIASRIDHLRSQFPQLRIAYLPQISGVQIKLKVVETKAEKAQQILEQAEHRLREQLDRYIYGTGDDSLEEIVAQLLFQQKLTVAVAESCTGGLISHTLTNIPGSSEYFKRGFITYTNDSKIELLGVSEKTIQEYGAVSEQTAAEMAEGVRRTSTASP
ncbi:MAG: CinA family nicotinamide mononucleotide deamidase-related protein, partial [Bacteroidales bacterium]|nr:CinA family nicotinamide mononucleotide deamidase-related protein [Bacteroidales bacterium]